MNPIGWIKTAGATAIVMILIVACWKINVWRERSAELNQVQQEYAVYRSDVTRQIAERDRRENVNREITNGYLGTLRAQEVALLDARRRLAGVRLRIDCPTVPAAPAGTAPAAGAPAEGPDESSRLVDASAIAERFASCDGVAARLNALINWHERATR